MGVALRDYLQRIGHSHRQDAAVQDRMSLYRDSSVETLRARGIIVGTPSAIQDQLAALEAVGVQRVMLQWIDLDDLDGLEQFAQVVL